MPGHVAQAIPKVKGKMVFKAHNQRPIASTSTSKRKRPSPPSDDEEDPEDSANDSLDDADVESEADTEDEIEAAQGGKSRKTAKRKRRATSPTTFGAALLGLLGNENEETHQKGPSTILSLAPHIRRSAQSSKLNEKASRLAIEAKRKRADRARVTDVISGWGPPGQPPKTADGSEKTDDPVDEELKESAEMKEWQLQGGAQGYEKKLRKVAQRGVVKLFNAIRAAQNTTESDLEQDDKIAKNQISKAPASNNLKGENALGSKGRAVKELSKSNFFDLIRSGSKTAVR